MDFDGFSFHSFHVHYTRDTKTMENLQVLYLRSTIVSIFLFILYS